jgi:hypothetical protein
MLLDVPIVLLDVFTEDPTWGEWSQAQLTSAANRGTLVLNAVVLAEIAPLFSRIEALRDALPSMAVIEAVPFAASFLAGHAHANYRRAGGTRENEPSRRGQCKPSFSHARSDSPASPHRLSRRCDGSSPVDPRPQTGRDLHTRRDADHPARPKLNARGASVSRHVIDPGAEPAGRLDQAEAIFTRQACVTE